MPYSTQWEPRGVLWTFRGVVTGEELLRSNQEIYGDERFDDIDYQIVDLSMAETFEVSEDDMIVLAASDRAAAASNPHIRIAVVATDAMAKRLSNCYQQAIANSPWHHGIFESMAEARAWACRMRNAS